MTTHTQPAAGRSLTPLVLAALGASVLAVALAHSPESAVAGAVAFAGALVLALVQTNRQVLTWPNAIVCLITIIWLIPIKIYRLPVALPFNLEVYRVAVLLLVLAFVIGVMIGALPVTASGLGPAIFALAGVAILSQVVNWGELNAPGESSAALKPLSYFLSFVAIFLLITAAIERLTDAKIVLSSLVVGGAIVACAAIVESRTRSNLFDNLDSWVPGLVKQTRELEDLRGGRLRVRGSAQHPIALGVSLTMVVPLALMLAQYAANRTRSVLWLIAGGICMMGAFVTVSRTVVAMAIVMVAVGLLLRAGLVTRFWPVLLVLPALAHAAAPGTLGALYKSIFPSEGLTAELEGRAGLGGSGRLADLGPGLDIWRDSPLVGNGLGYVATTGDVLSEGVAQSATQSIGGFTIIFDNQYLATLVSLGALGLLAAIWVVWGAAIKLIRAGRRYRKGPEADLVSACAIACAGFGTAMLFFDAFAFVQATLVFFIIAAVGLRLCELGLDPAPVIRLSERRAALLRRRRITIWDWTMRRSPLRPAGTGNRGKES